MGQAGGAPVSTHDRRTLIQIAQGGLYETAVGAMEARRTARDDIKRYVARIRADHAVGDQALQELAQAKGVSLPTRMTEPDRERLHRLRGQSGRSGDVDFVADAMRFNDEALAAARVEVVRTRDPEIEAFLRKHVAVIAAHQRFARGLAR